MANNCLHCERYMNRDCVGDMDDWRAPTKHRDVPVFGSPSILHSFPSQDGKVYLAIMAVADERLAFML